MDTAVTIFWFRRDLRLEDNHGLFKALQHGLPVIPLFIFDTNILENLPKNDARVSFIYDALSEINHKLKKHDSSLCIIHSKPEDAFKKLSEDYNVKYVFANNDYEPYAIARDKEIELLLKSKNISFYTFKDQVIFEKDEVVKPDGNPYTIFTPYSVVWKKKLNEQKLTTYPSEHSTKTFVKKTFDFPILKSLGFEKNNVSFSTPVLNESIIKDYHNTRNIPSVNGTTKLSVHLRFGTIGIRKLSIMAKKLNEQWLNELIWREFFMMILYHYPHVITHSFKPKYDKIQWRNDEKEFEAWCKGETGYPIVDAGMRELNETGFMHNRVRMIVASFLTKHLLIDWRWGEAYFAEKLMDYELSSNNGNWQWAAGCGCDAAPYFRIFNPTEQTKRFDPRMIYIKRWIGDTNTYKLKPIVEHEFARKRALETYKKYLLL